MIGNSSCGEHGDSVVIPDTSEIFAETGNEVVGDQISAFFGAEDIMNKDVGIFVRHGANIHKGRESVCVGCHKCGCAVPKRDSVKAVPKARNVKVRHGSAGKG